MTTKACRSCGYQLNTGYAGRCPSCKDANPHGMGVKDWLAVGVVCLLVLLFGAASSSRAETSASVSRYELPAR